ncbi:MAG: anthranilate phosphoribosyltransferase [bacterium]|nr:MAG: anthranilate phosphoribosyltransferase [bacterium]
MDYSKLLEKIITANSLEETEAYDLMGEILAGNLSGEKISGLLVALRCKGEISEEILGFVRAMRDFAVVVDTSAPVVDTCGTGGDGAHTFNISTTAAFIAAGAGVTIAKHHNRSVSSRCGSADVLEELGIDINMSPDKIKKTVEKIGIGFCFAPLYHQSMKYAAGARKELGIRTVFNMLGPLLNPFLSQRQVIGVFAPHLTELFAQILHKLGSKHIFIVHGEDGLDEFTICGKTRVTELVNNTITTKYLSPEHFGFKREPSSSLIGGTKEENSMILKNILLGEKGPKRDVAVLNAALAITCSGKNYSIQEGISMAEQSIDSGAAMQKLNDLIEFSAEG